MDQNQSNLLFSKRKQNDKSDKGTSMGEENNNSNGLLGASQKNQKNNNTEEKSETNENKKENNETKIQKVAENYLKTEEPVSLADLQRRTQKLKDKIKLLEEKIAKERNEVIQDINKYNEEINQNNVQVKKLSNQFNKQIEALKKYEESLNVKEKKKPKTIIKSKEEIEKQMDIVDTQIAIYEQRAKKCEEDYNNSLKVAEKKENAENELQVALSRLNDQISTLKSDLDDMRKTDIEHKHCKRSNRLLLEKFNGVNKAYQYELRLAKLLALNEMEDRHQKDNEIIEEGDSEAKAIKDAKNILPLIHSINFNPNAMIALEAKIIQRNKVGVKCNKSNSINLYKKISKEFNLSDNYIIEANKNICINQSNGSLKTDDNLFKDYEHNLLRRIIPEKMMNNYEEKYYTILKQKNDFREKFKNESCDIKNENMLLNNKKDFNNLKLKESNRKNAILNLKKHKLEQKVKQMIKNCQEIKKLIKKEEEKLVKGEKEAKRIEIYFKEMTGKKKKAKKSFDETE